MTNALISAARALAKSQCGEDCFDALEEEAHASLIEDVRAVLGAIREPSEEMMDAAPNPGDVVGCYGPEGDYEYRDDGEKLLWQALIDKALSE